ncbi:hypothetical protein BSKO_05632 [Bryopsis sp. KO-2023]|nr:hypothetical protein BSKO_05632 [Bryopsis sp. KO-2023]
MWKVTQTPPSEGRPIVVIFGWFASRKDLLKRYVDLFDSLGCDVFAFSPHSLSLWFPRMALRNALKVLEELSREINSGGHRRPILFANFSGSPKTVYYKLIQILSCQRSLRDFGEKYHVLRGCLCGEIYDSSPTDFTSEQGVRALAVASRGKLYHPVVEGILNVSACSLDFFFVDVFEADRKTYWSTLGSSPVQGPVLFLYSHSDPVASGSLIDGFSKLLKSRGREVWVKKWRSSDHVAHFKSHSEEYRDVLEKFLDKAVTSWRARVNGDTAIKKFDLDFGVIRSKL